MSLHATMLPVNYFPSIGESSCMGSPKNHRGFMHENYHWHVQLAMESFDHTPMYVLHVIS